jgi:hypothetical protein
MHEQDDDLSWCADPKEGDSSFEKTDCADRANVIGCFVYAFLSDGLMASFARFLQSHGLLASFARFSRPRTGLGGFVRAPFEAQNRARWLRSRAFRPRRRVLGFVRALSASTSLATHLPSGQEWVRSQVRTPTARRLLVPYSPRPHRSPTLHGHVATRQHGSMHTIMVSIQGGMLNGRRNTMSSRPMIGCDHAL